MSNKPIPIGKEDIVYKGKIVEIVQQKMKIGDSEKIFEIARRSPGTRIIIVTPNKKILLTKEYRVEIGGWDYRIPGGKVFDTLDEYNQFHEDDRYIMDVAMNAAKKEAREEAGIEALSINHFDTLRCGATMEWDLFYFVVDRYEAQEQDLEEGENIEMVELDFNEVRDLCLSGGVREGRSAAVLMRYLHLQR